jgi:hypothetical protein
MFKQVKIFFQILVLLAINLSDGFSQTTSSPYSIFGLGNLESHAIGPSKAMGGTGIAFQSDKSINPMNPASYCGLDSLFSIFELGVFGKYTTYSTYNETQSLVNGNLKYVAMGFRIAPWVATSFGFLPYSSIGYEINVKSPVEGTNQEYLKTFSGSGGVNQVYLGASIMPVKNLSLGFNAAYLFGNITHAESSTDYTFYLEDATYISNFDFNYGLNYQLNIKSWKYNLGFIYGNSKRLRTKNITTIKTEFTTEILKNREYKYNIPRNFGAGLVVNKGFFSAGIDYELSEWADVKFSNNFLQTRNSNRYSFGVEIPSQGFNKGTGRMIFYRFGAEFRESYLVIDNTPIDHRSFTLGAGIPLNGFLSVVNVSLEVGQNGTTRNDLIKETFFNLHLDLSLKDLWFRKRLYD